MSRARTASIIVVAAVAVVAAGSWYLSAPTPPPASEQANRANVAAAERKILYYRDSSGAPLWSATPKRDPAGRDYLAVYDDEEPSLAPAVAKPRAAEQTRKILYYRNPMGLPDTSPVPKKDSMGMDYIPVYQGDESEQQSAVKVSLDKIQRSGVRTEPVEVRVITRPVRAVGTVAVDERRLTVVTMRADGFIEDLFVNTFGQSVREGEPLFRVYSKDIQMAQADLIVAAGVKGTALQGLGQQSVQGSIQRLRNLGVPESRIREVRETGANPRTIDWPAPAIGTVIAKKIVNGQMVTAGDELYRIADLSKVWVIADVAESDIGAIKLGTRSVLTFRAYPAEPIESEVTFIYPEVKPETRTVRVRIELPNADGRLKTDMYAEAAFRIGADAQPVVAVHDSSVIDSGTRQVVLIAKGDGRFEPRAVKLGRRGDGYVEVIDGVKEGETVVTAATFLIDAESNLKAALKAFTQQEGGP